MVDRARIRYLRVRKIFLTVLKWHFGQINVSVCGENYEDFRVLTTMGHASHTGHVTRTASTESGSPIDDQRLPDFTNGSLRPTNEAREIHHDDVPQPLPQPMQSPHRGQELPRPKKARITVLRRERAIAIWAFAMAVSARFSASGPARPVVAATICAR